MRDEEIILAVREELESLQEGRVLSDSVRVQLLEGFLGLGDWLSIHPDGFLWFRGLAQWTDEEGAPLIEQLLDQYDVEHFFVGRTPQADGMIRSRFGGPLYLADTGMLASHYPGGRASMREISDAGFEMIYLERPPATEGPVVESVK